MGENFYPPFPTLVQKNDGESSKIYRGQSRELEAVVYRELK